MYCDFINVTEIISHNMKSGKTSFYNNILNTLFATYLRDRSIFGFDNSVAAKLHKGTFRVPIELSEYYMEADRSVMCRDIRELVSYIFDMNNTYNEMYELIQYDNTLSDSMRSDILSRFKDRTIDRSSLAELIYEAVYIAVTRQYVKKDGIFEVTVYNNTLSAKYAALFANSEYCSPCRYFGGRDEELDELHNVISENSSVIITGIAGIGKSEFVRMYAQQHSSDYPYFGYYFYKGSLKSIIADVIDDPIVSDIDVRYSKNLKLLSKLGENVLLIIDNFNTAIEDDECIYDLLDLKCKVIFTSHMNYDDLCTYELKGFRSNENSFELISKFYQYQNKDIPHLTAIFDAVDNHIFCVELCARLLKKGFYTPETLAEKIVGGALKGIMERFSASKDKRQKKKTYYDHIRDLFDLLKLPESYSKTLMMMIVAPDKGIRKDFFAKLIELKDLNILEDLVEFGLIYEYKNGTVTVHSVIRSLIQNEYTPSFEKCGKLVESIRAICVNEAVTAEVDSSVFQDVILLAINYISFDSIDENFRFVSDCMKYFDRYGNNYYCESIIKWEEQHHENDKSRKEILYWNDLAYYKTLQNKVGYAFKSYKKAIECFDNCDDTVLKANILSNYGALLNSENRVNEATKYIKEAVELFDQVDDSKEFLFDKYRAIINYANIISGYGKVGESITLITAAEKKLREYGLQGTDVYAKCLISDGICKICIGDRSAAVSLYKGLTLMIRLYGKDSHYVKDVVGSIQPYLPLLLRYSPLKELLSC